MNIDFLNEFPCVDLEESHGATGEIAGGDGLRLRHNGSAAQGKRSSEQKSKASFHG